ncbi:MAG: hypothetical protein RIS21_1079 [Planctomycetota bacterium]
MIQRVRIVGHAPDSFRDTVIQSGFSLDEDRPDVIIAYGGDGTLIGAERSWPEVPKLGIRTDDTCVKCPRHADDVVLDRLRAGRMDEEQLLKLEGRFRDHLLLAVNDIIFRNADPRAAVRFVVSLNGMPVTEEVIGDGLVVATPFGSSAYFRSVTRMAIRCGIGIAFNNCTDFLHHLVMGESEALTIDLTRGPATLTCDNDPSLIPVDTGDRIAIRKAPGSARLLGVDTLRCTDCRYVNAPRRRY